NTGNTGMPTTRWSPTVYRLGAIVALAFCFVAGYAVASLWSSARDTSPLAQICARVDYVNGLQENLKGQDPASEEVSVGLKALVEQCRAALRDRAEENDEGRWVRRSSARTGRAADRLLGSPKSRSLRTASCAPAGEYSLLAQPSEFDTRLPFVRF